MIKIIVNGAKGKMGILALQTLENHPDFEVVAALSKEDNLKVQIEEKNPDIVLDLTRPEAVYQNALTIIEANVHPVIGTSGLSDKEIQELQERAQEKELGGLIVPNFSIAVILMMHFAKLASAYLPEVEIIETHHQDKIDAPSATALKTAKMIAEARTKTKNNLVLKEIIQGARGAKLEDINIHSLRLPGLIAKQEVVFGSQGETLSIIHESLDRLAFMPGVILACQKVIGLKHLAYGLEQVLDLTPAT